MSNKILFNKHVEWALKNFQNPEALGIQSPLATPFLLGAALAEAEATDTQRGQVLQGVIATGIQKMSGGKSDREQEVLQAYYQDKLSEPAALERFSLTKTPFHRLRRKAIESLSLVLIQELKPAIRLERPSSTLPTFYGRENEMELCRSAIGQNALLWITGPSGIGKSAVAQVCTQSWPAEQLFWLTLKPEINDHTHHFVFELGYFLSRCGYPTLWQECITNAKIVHEAKLLSIIRHAFDALQNSETPALLCIDNVGLLERTQNPEHEQLIQLLLSLRNMTPLVLIGQRAITDADTHCALSGLSPRHTSQWLEAEGILLSKQELTDLYTYLQGNPRLVELTIMLYRRGLSIGELLSHLQKTPGTQFLIERVVQHLTEAERSALIELSIFRNGAPADVWSTTESRAALFELQGLGLVWRCSPGTVQAQTIYSTAITHSLSAVRLQLLHQWAAQIFEERGAYTDAIHHLVQADEYQHAISLWTQFGTQEINQGQAHSAFQIFSRIAQSKRPSTENTKLTFILADLERLLGHTQSALSRLDAIVDGTPLQTVSSYIKRGEIENDMGRFSDARGHFKQAIDESGELIGLQLTRAHKGLAWANVRERSLEDARAESVRARYEVENLQGYLAEIGHDYEQAVAYYQAALQLAEELSHDDGIARTSSNLARLYIWLGNFAEASRFQERAERSYQRIGKQLSIIGVQINRALLQNAMGEHQKAVDTLLGTENTILALPDQLPDWPQALIAQGLAEAYLGLNDLDQAKEMVQKAIGFEEDGILADAYRTYGEIMHRRGQFETAEEFINNSITLLNQHDDPDQYLLGYAWRALAKLYRDQDKPDRATEAKQTAIEHFQAINLPYEVERTKEVRVE